MNENREYVPGTHAFLREGVDYHIATELGEISLVGLCLASQREFAVTAAEALGRGNVNLLRELPGSYTAVMQRPGECVITAGLAGQYPIYWREQAEGICLSTEGKDLGYGPNAAYLAASIICCQELVSGQTALTDVYQLEGGQTAHFIDSRLAALTEPEIIPDTSMQIADAASNLREALTEAIIRRVQTGKKVTSDFSGGLDSTTLALLAAYNMRSAIDAFVYYRPGIAVGDLYFSRQIAADCNNIRLHEFLQDATTLPFTNMSDQVVTGIGPDPWTVWSAQSWNSLATLHTYGSEIHLSGDGGDALLTPHPGYVVDLVHQGRLEHLQRVCQARARVMNIDPTHLYNKALHDANRTLADDMKTLAGYLMKPEDVRKTAKLSRYAWLSLSEQHSHFLTAGMRQTLAGLAEQRAATIDSRLSGGLATYSALAEIRNAGVNQQYLRSRAQEYNIEPHAPYLDDNVIRACLQAPAAVRAAPGEFKYILREAFKGILPQSLLSRQSKSTYDGEVYRGLRNSFPQIVKLIINNCRLADLGIIEPRRVLEELDRLDMGHEGLLAGIQNILSAEIWLRARDGEI